MSLQDLVEATGPLARAYFESQERAQERELKFDAKVLEEESRRFRYLLLSGTALGIGILVLAAILVFKAQPGEARELIALIVSIVAAGFGGYGIAKGGARPSQSED